jgi:hypothetical protein
MRLLLGAEYSTRREIGRVIEDPKWQVGGKEEEVRAPQRGSKTDLASRGDYGACTIEKFSRFEDNRKTFRRFYQNEQAMASAGE